MRKVSDILRDEREKQGYSLSDIQKALKIRKEFLLAIEDGRLHDLPSESYALGFVKNYATFLGLDQKTISAFFRREYKKEEKVSPVYQSKSGRIRKKPLFHMGNVIIIGVVLVIVAYIIFQYGSLLFNPKLEIHTPKEGALIKDSIVTISGVTDQYATVTVDGQETYVDLDGTFRKNVFVFPGEKKIEVVARSRFGKETRLIRTIQVK